ncbi:hypothetical protein NKI80_23370 [Mesorhizobium sp. M0387]|uniref:hypothetical protein n=1 Tax=Mesorhizobium sp. M0387 TaxID=2956940 RepID=UPI0033372F88
MTTHMPLARYSATNGALVSGFATAELHHLMGHDLRTPSQARGRLAERILPWAPRNLPEAAICLPSTRPKSWRDFKLHRLVSCTFQKATQFGGKLISKRALLNLCPFPTKRGRKRPSKRFGAMRSKQG